MEMRKNSFYYKGTLRRGVGKRNKGSVDIHKFTYYYVFFILCDHPGRWIQVKR